ncbi:hypothetical protein Tco_0756232, partial [Tanacetum coccineum]
GRTQGFGLISGVGNKELFPRIYLLDSNKNCTVAERVCSLDWSTFLRRNPRGGVEVLGSSVGFSVASVRHLIDSRTLDTDNVATRWNRKDIETVNHSFFNCRLAKDLWALLAKWWELDIPICRSILEWYDWLDSLHVSSNVRLLLEGVGGTLMWTIWYYRNQLVFSSSHPKKATL